MVLCINIGNSEVKFCVFSKNKKLLHWFEITSDRNKTADEYEVIIRSLFDLHEIDMTTLHGAIAASVVPDLTYPICHSVSAILEQTPMLVGPGVKTALDIKTDHPGEVGSDLVANAVAALCVAEAPTVVIDFGTATSVLVIEQNRRLTDVFILPGLFSSYRALTREAAEIPAVPLYTPKTFSGKNTANSVNAGIIYSNAFTVDGYISKLKEVWNTSNITAIATGAGAEIVLPLSKNKIEYRKHLTCEGLYEIYLKNRT